MQRGPERSCLLVLQKEPVQAVELAHELNKPGVAHFRLAHGAVQLSQLHAQSPQPHGIYQVYASGNVIGIQRFAKFRTVDVTAIELLVLVARKDVPKGIFLSLVLQVGLRAGLSTRRRGTDGARGLPLRDVNWTPVRGRLTRGPQAEGAGWRQTEYWPLPNTTFLPTVYAMAFTARADSAARSSVLVEDQ